MCFSLYTPSCIRDHEKISLLGFSVNRGKLLPHAFGAYSVAYLPLPISSYPATFVTVMIECS